MATRKKKLKNLEISPKSVTFAPAVSNGVMVAQQVLVLFVVVRIRLGQRNAAGIKEGFGPSFLFIHALFRKIGIFSVNPYIRTECLNA
jgi:hypothetical protein